MTRLSARTLERDIGAAGSRATVRTSNTCIYGTNNWLAILARCEQRAIDLYYAAPPDKLAGECRAELVAEFGEDVVKAMLSKGIGNNTSPLMEIKHDEMVRTLAKSGAKIAEEMTAEDANALHMAVEPSPTRFAHAGSPNQEIKKACQHAQ